MDTFFRFALALIDAYPQWIAVNVVTPMALPALGALLGAVMMGRNVLSAVLDTFRFGQLGWVAIAWMCSAMFDGWQHISDTHTGFSWAAWIFVFGLVTCSFGTLVSVYCSETKGRDYRHCVFACLSACLALSCAGASTYTHHQLVTKEFYAYQQSSPPP